MAAPNHVYAGDGVASASPATFSWAAEQAGDLGLLVITTQRNAVVTTPSGWTLLTSTVSSEGSVSDSAKLTVFWKLAESSSEPDVSVEATSTDFLYGFISTFRGVDQTTPIEAFSANGAGSASTSRTLNSLTAGGADRLLVYAISTGDDTASAPVSTGSSPIGGLSTHRNAATATGSGGGLALFSAGTTTAAGATGSGSVTFNYSTGSVGLSILLNPQAVAEISGTTAGTATTTGTLIGSGALVGSADAAATASGTMVGAGVLVGQSDAAVTVTGTMSGAGVLAGSADAVLSTTGTIVGLTDSLLAGIIPGVATVTGTLTGVGALVGTAAATASASGTMGATGALTGSSNGILTTSGQLFGLSGMSGVAAGVLTVPAATLEGQFTLGGNSAGVATVTGTLSGLGSLSGVAAAVLSTTGTMAKNGALAGSIAATMTAIGTLRGLISPTASQNFRDKWLAVYNARQALHNKISGVTKLTLESQSTAITSLQNSITHPTTGLAALSSAQTILNSRVTLAEGEIDAIAEDITNLNVEVDGKASVSVTNSLTARIDTIDSPYGFNLLNNAGLVVDMRNWGTVFWNQASDPNWIVERNLLGVGYQVVGFNNFGFRHPGTPATGVSFVAGSDFLEATPGIDYIASGKISSANLALADLRLYFLDSTLVPLGEVAAAPNSIGYAGGTNENNWVLSYVKATAPANTKWMRLGLRGLTNGGTAPRAQVMKAMIEQASPGQTVPTAWNTGRLAAWAEWDMQFDVNGHISGVRLASDGKTSDFIINADNFGVQKPGGGPALTWANGVLWNKGTTYSVILGQDLTPDEDVIFWIGPNPISPQAALKEDASIYFTEDGDAVFRGTLSQSLITGSAFELGSTRIHTGGGRLAPFAVHAAAYKGTGSRFSGAVTLTDFQSPDVGTGYHYKRFSRKRADVSLNCFFQGDGNANDRENLYLEVQYDGGAWTTITSKTNIDTDNHGSWVFLIRYTTLDTWDTVAFRARTTGGYSMILSLAVEIDNTYETGNTAGSWSGTDASSGTGGSAPPPPGSGGGGGGSGGGPYCVVADMAYLPDGTLVAANEVGTDFPCWNGQVAEPGIEWHPLRSMPFGHAPSYIVVTENGAAVPQSDSTPIPLRDGRMVTTLECLDQEVLTNIDGKLEWSRVISLDYLGVVRVAKPDLGDRVFFAGMNPAATIATHNIRDKGLDP